MKILASFAFCVAVTAFAQSQNYLAQARAVLQHGAESGNPMHRRETALALGLLDRREPSEKLLGKLAADKDVEVQVAAIGSIADLHDESFAPMLEKYLDDQPPEVSFAAAKCLWSLGHPIGRDFMLSVLGRERKARSGRLHREFRHMVRTFSTPKGAILFTLEHGMGGAVSLVGVPIPGVGAGFAALDSLLFESEISPRASVALALARDKDPETVDALLSALRDDNWSVKAAAAQAIGMRNDPMLRNYLVPLFQDDSHRVRYRAAAAHLRLAGIAEAGATREPRAR